MNEELKSWLIILLLIGIPILLGITIYIYLKRRYTKERFAFFAVFTLAALAFAIITPILGTQSIWGVIILAINHLLGLNIPYIEPTIYEQVLAVIIFFICANFLFRVHKNWESEVMTIRQYENDKRNKRSSIYKDFFAQFKAFIGSNNKLELYDKGSNLKSQKILGKHDYQKLPWHENVAEIFELISNQYKIDAQTDWYNETNCFVSEYGKENEKIHIHCCLEEPKKSEMDKIITFAKQTSNKPSKIIIAIHKSGIRKKQQLKNFDIEYRYKDELLEEIVDFTNYKNYIKKRFSQNEIDIGTELSVSDMYVSSSGILETNNENIANIDKYILKWSDERSSKHIAVLGQYGQGKSVLALKITDELLQKSTKRTPILMELRGKSPRNLSPLEIIATWASNFRIEPQAILKLHNEGKLLLIFEGFDEMDLVGDAEMRMNHL